MVFRAHASSRAWEDEIVRIWVGATKLSKLMASDGQPTLTERIFGDGVLPVHPPQPLPSTTSGNKRNIPKISEGPHLEVFDFHVLLLLRLHTVLAWPPATPGSRRIRLGLWRHRSRVTGKLVGIHLLLVLPRARSTRPPIPAARLR